MGNKEKTTSHPQMLCSCLCVLRVILPQKQKPSSSQLPKYLSKWGIKESSDVLYMHRHECVSCVRVCESEQGCVEACVQFFGSTAARVLCSSGALLEAAVSIVWERRVSTYYTSQMVHRKYQREREREVQGRDGVTLFRLGSLWQHDSVGVNISLILSMCFPFKEHYSGLKWLSPPVFGFIFRKSTDHRGPVPPAPLPSVEQLMYSLSGPDDVSIEHIWFNTRLFVFLVKYYVCVCVHTQLTPCRKFDRFSVVCRYKAACLCSYSDI